MTPVVWLAGALKDHARGRRLLDFVDETPAVVPDRGLGVCLFFGGEFQKLGKAAQSEWLDWSQAPGRVFLLLPPYQLGVITALLDWEVLSGGSVNDSMAPALPQRLSAEVRFQFKGSFQVPSKPAGAWGNGTINTCLYRRHPHAGLFAATCLPLWSLALLDAKSELKDWLSDLLALAGKTVGENEGLPSTAFALRPEHYALLLHLCSEEFSSDDDALKALPKSKIFRLPSIQARQCLTDLETCGLIKGGQLTRAGRNALSESSYEPFAYDLEVNRR